MALSTRILPPQLEPDSRATSAGMTSQRRKAEKNGGAVP
jgi:hypothetical protein